MPITASCWQKSTRETKAAALLFTLRPCMVMRRRLFRGLRGFGVQGFRVFGFSGFVLKLVGMSWLALLPCEVCELLLECRADIHAQEGEHALNMPQHAPPKPTGTPKPSSFSFGCAFFAWSLHRHMFRLVFDHVLPFCSSFKYPLHQAACGVAEGATEGSDYGILRLSILASFFLRPFVL